MRGRLVTFSGMDGSGKSTLASMAADWLGTRGLTVVRTGLGGHGPVEPLVRWLRRRAGAPEGDALTDRTNPLLRPGPRPRSTKLWPLIAYVDSRAVRALEVLPALARGEWVVADRSFIDRAAGLVTYDYASLGTAQALVRAFPRADFEFILTVDAEAARLRERDNIHPPTFFRRMRASY